MTDLDLLQQLASSSTDERNRAFREIATRYLPLIYAAARCQLPDASLAEDVSQAVFLVLLQKASTLSKNTLLPAWLLTVTHNICKDVRKRAARRHKHEQKAAAMTQTFTPPAPAYENDYIAVTPHLDAAIAALSPTDRTAIILRYFQQRPFNEIGETLHLTEPATKKRIERALRKLRDFFSRRKITLSLAAIPLALAWQSQHAAAVPPTLAAAISTLSTTTASPALLALAKPALHSLFWTPAKIAAAFILMLAAGSIASLAIAPSIAAPPTSAIADAPTLPPPPISTQPLPPTAETQHLRELLYQIRYCLLIDEPAPSFALLRELVQIGKPAVPEIVAELDRTTGDNEFRALTFALRLIDDPRAVPALIRALPRVSVYSNDMGCWLKDQDLWNFASDHRLEKRIQKFPEIFIPRAVREIDGALRAITGNAIDNPALEDAKNDKPENLAIAHQLRQDAANAWQEWWDANANKLVSAQDLDSLKLFSTIDDPVESAGVARFGPFFPTAPNIHLGPVHDLILQPQERWDYHSFIDFDTGRTFAPLEASRVVMDRQFDYTAWNHQTGIDASTMTFITNIKPNAKPLPGKGGSPLIIVGQTDGPSKYLYALSSLETHAWRVDNTRWNTIDAEAHTGKPLDIPHKSPSCYFGDYREFPRTFLIITRNGGHGILQILNSSDHPLGIHFRYRMFEGFPATNEPQLDPPLSVLAGLTFTPEKTITLHSVASTDPSAINLGTGETFPYDSQLLQRRGKHIFAPRHDWLTQHHADMLVQPEVEGNLFALDGDDMTICAISTEAWTTLSAEEVCRIVARRAPDYGFMMPDNTGDRPATWAFKTREGAIGLLQFLDGTPTTLTFHYKQIQK